VPLFATAVATRELCFSATAEKKLKEGELGGRTFLCGEPASSTTSVSEAVHKNGHFNRTDSPQCSVGVIAADGVLTFRLVVLRCPAQCGEAAPLSCPSATRQSYNTSEPLHSLQCDRSVLCRRPEGGRAR
jgi:hypothetical protein